MTNAIYELHGTATRSDRGATATTAKSWPRCSDGRQKGWEVVRGESKERQEGGLALVLDGQMGQMVGL